MSRHNGHVIGIGLNKTGTKTLGGVMAALGYQHYSRRIDWELVRRTLEWDFSGVRTVLANYESFEDWPWPLIYRPLAELVPDALFILTTRRDSLTWYGSLCRHAERTGPTEERRLIYGHSMPHEHEAELITMYENHNGGVRQFFDRRPGRLLEVCWETGSGWREVCDFLGVEAPDLPFPHRNRNAEMVVRRGPQ